MLLNYIILLQAYSNSSVLFILINLEKVVNFYKLTKFRKDGELSTSLQNYFIVFA